MNNTHDGLDMFNNYCNHLLAARISSFEQFDKTILYLSSGGLALSLTFIKDIVPIPHLISFPILLLSWISFGCSIIFTLTSFIFSRYAIDKQLEYAKKNYIDKLPDYANKVNPFSKITNILNFVSGSTFFIGFLFTIIFSSINLSKELTAMSEEKNEQKVPVSEGYVPPVMPQIPNQNADPSINQDKGNQSETTADDSGASSQGTPKEPSSNQNEQ